MSADDRVSSRLAALAGRLDDYPLDLQDLCNGTGAAADEAFPFAVAMVARSPALVESTLLAAVNVGGDAAAVGACVGAMLGALHGTAAFPPDWLAAVEDAAAIRAEAEALADALGGRGAASPSGHRHRQRVRRWRVRRPGSRRPTSWPRAGR